MAGNVVVDAGPIVAWLNARDAQHEWAKGQFGRLKPPLLTCEPVLAEAAFLVQRSGGDPGAVLALLVKGVLRVAISLQDEAGHLHALTRRYRDVPMSLADACLVLKQATPPSLSRWYSGFCTTVIKFSSEEAHSAKAWNHRGKLGGGEAKEAKSPSGPVVFPPGQARAENMQPIYTRSYR